MADSQKWVWLITLFSRIKVKFTMSRRDMIKCLSQPVHLRYMYLRRAFDVHPYILQHPVILEEDRRPWIDCVNTQADLGYLCPGMSGRHSQLILYLWPNGWTTVFPMLEEPNIDKPALSQSLVSDFSFCLNNLYNRVCMYVCIYVEVLRPSQPNGVISSAVSLPNHTFTGQA